MAKITSKNLPFMILGFVVFVALFCLLHGCKRKERFSNGSNSTSVGDGITYAVLGVGGLFILLWIGFAVFGKTP